MEKDYKTIGLIILSLLAIILLILVLIPKKEENINEQDNDISLVDINDIDFRLLGDTNYVLNSNEEYVEPGFVAYLKNGEDIHDFVEIQNDYLVENGKYKIKYNLEYENIKTSLTRYITIKNVSSSEIKIEDGERLTLKLNGEDTIYVLKDNQYKELGASAIDSKDGDISSKIKTSATINTSKVGEYAVKYSVTNSSNQTKEVDRKVIVYDLNYNILYTKSNSKVNLTFTVNDNYTKYLTINGEVKTLSSGANYFTIDDNKEYTLIITDKNNYKKEQKLNFINPVISCSATINSSSTIVTVSNRSNDIIKYNYYFNNQKYESVKTNYTLSGSYKNVSVEAINLNNNSTKVTCSVTENIPVPYFDAGLKELNYNGWNYYLYVPSNVRQNEKRPLVIFLHGSGERGNNIKNLNSYGFSKYIKKGQTYDSFILMPQLPSGKIWSHSEESKITGNLIKKVVNDYNIDEKKIAISGFSLGAIGVPVLVKNNENYFSCAVMIACSNEQKKFAPYFKNMPVRFYAGSKDTGQGNSSQTKAFYEAVKKYSSNTEWIIFNGASHNVVDKVFEDGKVYNWMISQTRN